MAYSFPKAGTRAAEHLTPDVMACLAHPSRVNDRQHNRAYAKNYFRTSTSGATGLYMMTLMGDDSIALCFYGIRGGFKVIWNFGRDKGAEWRETQRAA